MTGATHPASGIDPGRLKYLTENFNTLQGLRSVAFGIGYAVFMMSNAYWGSGGWSIFGSLCFLAAYKTSETYIPRYYDRRFGNVKQSPRRVRWNRKQLLFGFVRTVAVFLVWILAYFLLPSSVPGSRLTNSMVSAFGVELLLFGFPSTKLRGVCRGTLGVAVTAFALAPILYPLSESQLSAWKVVNAGSLGFCLVVFGLWDHITLILLFRNTAPDETDD
jgi:hypothetical protein